MKSHLKTITDRSASGFTLIEVLVSLAIFSVALMGLMHLNSQGSVELDHLRKQTLATYAADLYIAKWQIDTLDGASTASFTTDIGGIEWTIRPTEAQLSIAPDLPMSVIEVTADSGDVFFFDVFLP